MEERIDQIGLKKENVINRTKWRDSVYELSRNIRQIRPPALTETKPNLKK